MVCDCLSVCLSVCLSGSLSVCMSVHPSVCLSVCLSLCLFVCLYVCQSEAVRTALLLSLFHFFLNTTFRPKAFFRVNSTHKLQSLYTNGKHDAIIHTHIIASCLPLVYRLCNLCVLFTLKKALGRNVVFKKK